MWLVVLKIVALFVTIAINLVLWLQSSSHVQYLVCQLLLLSLPCLRHPLEVGVGHTVPLGGLSKGREDTTSLAGSLARLLRERDPS